MEFIMIINKFLKTALRIILPGLLFMIFSCAVNPVTGKRELMLVSTEQEIAIGKKTDLQVVEQYGIYPDQELQDYLTEIGQKMVPFTHRPDLAYSFKVVDSDVINAFAVPGGYVYFTRGILAYMNDEAELAGVLGHEIGHITARHSAKQMSQAKLFQIGFGVGGILSEKFRKYADFAGFGVQLMFLKFSRDHERQSDDLGVEYSTKAGYNSSRMAEFFYTLDRMRPDDGSALPGWFSTHPNPVNRVSAVRDKTVEWQKVDPAGRYAVNREQYLRKIDGLVFGPDPRQGFTEGQMFYHPTLKFKFPVPLDWQVNNLPTQVQMSPKSQEAAILFSLAKESNPTDAANQFILDVKATVSQNNTIQVNGMAARELLSDITSGQETIRILSFFIQKDEQVYIFHGLSSTAKYSNYNNTFRQTMTNFSKLTDEKFLNKQPKRLKLRSVSNKGSLKSILENFGVKPENLEKIALLNGLKLTDPVNQNMLLKTVIE